MPPKRQAQAGVSKKAEQKKKEKIIEDKTFGLKNKKGAKQQKFIKAVTHQVKFGQQNPRQVAQSEAEKKLKKDDKKKALQELNELFKPVVAAQKITRQCTKGDKCKFSHDLTLEKKCEKQSVYIDARDEELENDTMDNWDEKKLEEVVNKKHVISGREVFEFRPELVDDDDEEADDTHDTQGRGGDEVDDSVSVNDIDLSLYIPRDVASGGRAENGERSDLEEDKKGGRQQNGAIDAVPVDENLFTGEDLDELEELNTLDLEE
ncbi:hypothetical protein E5288_WYG012130 [Bos mutus]|uniref:C3H1-type domain-containing protein n=1 Tax=Bos mutus TaxID=72004 RepID=A0A6B0R2J9_9CETA|nr:hypothetical protein [Bos mutus]